MSGAPRPVVSLTRVGSRSAGDRARIAVAGLVVGLAGLVVVGALGGGAATQPEPVRPPAPVTAASEHPTPVATFGPTERPAVRTSATSRAGYTVSYRRDAAHRPIVFDGGALAIFGYGERVPDGSYQGTVRVAVGTPARGASIAARAGTRLVYSATLAGLLDEYLRDAPAPPVIVTGGTIDGVDAARLDFAPGGTGQPGSAVALAVHGGRAFVITATGFEGLYPDGAPASAGLAEFLRQMRFTGLLFVSRALGFQVAAPLGIEPAGEEGPGPNSDGYCVFADGEPTAEGGYTHAISVSVGSFDHPARVEVLDAGGTPGSGRIWAASLVQLQGAYLAAIGGRSGSSATIRVGGELGLLVERPGGLAATVLAVRAGRVYIVSTTGYVLREPAPGFEAFLDGFTFLDPGR